MYEPTDTYAAKAAEAIRTAMDEKSAKAILDGLEDRKYRIVFGNRNWYALLQEASTGVHLAYIWFPQAEGNPYGDVEVGDRLLEQIWM